MSKHSLTYILISVVVLLGSVVGYNYYQKQQAAKTQASAREFISAIPTDTVTAITLIKKDSAVELAKQNDAWIITSDHNTAGDSTAITELFATLNHLTVQAIASQHGDADAAKFSLDAEQRLEVILKASDQEIAKIYVGKTGAVPQTFYVQKPNDNNIYLVNGARYQIDQTDWKQPENPDTGIVTDTTVPVSPAPAK